MKLGKKEHFSHWEWGRHSAPKTQSENPYMICLFSSYYCQENTLYWVLTIFSRPYTGAGSGGGAPDARAPPKIGKNMIFWRKIVIFHTKYLKNVRASLGNWKNMIFWRKIVIFHTKYPKNFRASLCSAQFFLSAPP